MNIESLVYIPIHIAPGIYIRVIDEIYPDVSHPEKFNALFFIASDYGPANQLVPITSEEQYIRTFGSSNIKYPWSSIMAQNHAKYATAYCIRLLPYDATYGNIVIGLTPLFVGDIVRNPNIIPNNLLNDETKNKIQNPNQNNISDIAKNINNKEIYVFRIGHIKPNNKVDYLMSFTLNNQSVEIDCVQCGLGSIIAQFSGLGEFYNSMAIGFSTNVNNTFDLTIYKQIDVNNYSVILTVPGRSIFNQYDDYGTNIKLESGKRYGGLLYELNEININNIKQTTNENVVIYVKQYNGFTYVNRFIAPNEIDTVKGAELIKSIINLQDKNHLRYGSDGSLKDNNGNFNYSVFASMIADTLYGRSRITGSNNSYMAEPIYDLLDEELFIKYIYDPTDHRFEIEDRNIVHIALHDFARNRYFTNSGAIVLANLAPINDPFDKAELDNKQIIRSELFTAYVSTFDGVVNGYSYNNWPQLQLIARDLIIYRSQKGLYDSFAGAIAAQHSGVRNINRKYTLAERDILTLRGLNFLVKDQRYGVYTDLGRTTYPFNSPLRWLYVIEDIIDIKYELKIALKPFLHKLETYDWNTLIRRIDNMVFKQRKNMGLLTEYNIQLVQDENYILQNILPIVITLRYARSIERISVTLYVK